MYSIIISGCCAIVIAIPAVADSVERSRFGLGATEIDFDSLANGTILSDQYASLGVTFEQTVALNSSRAVSMPNAIDGFPDDLGLISIHFPAGALRVGVQIDTDGFGSERQPQLRAFGSDGALLGIVNFDQGPDFAGWEDAHEIARIELGAFYFGEGRWGQGDGFDNLVFELQPSQDCNANGVADAVDVSVVHWTAAYGLAPDDPRIAPQHRFDGAPFEYEIREFLRVLDASETQELGISKNDASTLVQIGSNWALEVALRMISHSRPSLDWGATIGVELYGKSVRLAVSHDGAGFQASSGNAWLAGQFASINTDDAFHSFRIARSGSNVLLFIDAAQQPAITIPLADFTPSSYAETANVIAASTSNGGVAEYLVESITFNPATVETRNVADCNANLVPDFCDINSGTSLDETNDGVPDECQCVGDLTGDRVVSLSDLASLLSNFGSCCTDAEFYAPADIDNRCCVDLADLALLLKRFGLQCN